MQISHIKKALITGATSELAFRIAEELASYNIHLILTSKSRESLLEIAAILGKKTTISLHIGDLRELKARQELVELMGDHKPDLLINNAGIGLYGPALSHTTDEQLAILDTNGRVVLELTLEMARLLKDEKRKGIILNIGSATSFFPFPTFSVYSASKAFVRLFSLGLDDELKCEGIRVLCACPGQIETGFRIKAAKNFPQKPTKQALSTEKAAQLLIGQIVKERPLYIFDWRYKLAILFMNLIPRSLMNRILRRTIRDRYPH